MSICAKRASDDDSRMNFEHALQGDLRFRSRLGVYGDLVDDLAVDEVFERPCKVCRGGTLWSRGRPRGLGRTPFCLDAERRDGSRD